MRLASQSENYTEDNILRIAPRNMTFGLSPRSVTKNTVSVVGRPEHYGACWPEPFATHRFCTSTRRYGAYPYPYRPFPNTLGGALVRRRMHHLRNLITHDTQPFPHLFREAIGIVESNTIAVFP